MRAIGFLALALAAGACSTPGWNGSVDSWGSMSEVMRDGKTQARVSLVDATHGSTIVGIGTLTGLQGEIAIVDSVAWVARIDHGRLECGRGARTGDRATLLATADVRRWKTVAIDRDLSPAELDAFLASTARDFGLGQRPWPFVVEGDLADVEAHVLNGQCPYAGPVDPKHEPIRRSFPLVRARLVGFYAPNAVGELVHHGQATHVHVLVEEPEVFVGHVDSASVRNGAWLRVPAID
jgi:alpha-acetolactate decarboxylase